MRPLGSHQGTIIAITHLDELVKQCQRTHQIWRDTERALQVGKLHFLVCGRFVQMLHVLRAVIKGQI